MRRVYKSAVHGKDIDMEILKAKNEMTVAIGNGQLNARGDQLGSGGKVVKKREEVVAEYYDQNPKAMAIQNDNPPAKLQPTVETSIPVVETSKPVVNITENKKKV